MCFSLMSEPITDGPAKLLDRCVAFSSEIPVSLGHGFSGDDAQVS
jgi:hypothetical protein